ncbi:transcription factor a general transcription factor, putative [Ichthyophthirius multifiliis]|uniref:Transcription factor a general transcription factor, putative n=1 Tax=Ichthyophthirius multifiliis TaxID=5932 RepID=G0R0W3_ICHMU|nr:transcription factor a general transcription factor, putative [Ichthyophthirius multifiliis]EGR28874.1 transcription factor a general transcription factor, putative [Ichthyophthirius multifiliis]|eukprot:XP_004030110.1 transcription factor a general transcription factor, putative [Ichthyophthirius multifiliis]
MPNPEVFIKVICQKMDLEPKIYDTAIYLNQKAIEKNIINGQHAATIAASIVKLAASLYDVELPVKQICETSNVCQISLRSLYRQIYPQRFKLIEENNKLCNDINKIKKNNIQQ